LKVGTGILARVEILRMNIDGAPYHTRLCAYHSPMIVCKSEQMMILEVKTMPLTESPIVICGGLVFFNQAAGDSII